MNYSFNILDWYALAPGLNTIEQWENWALQPFAYDWASQSLAKFQKLPMMLARRMSIASKLAVEAALQLIEEHPDIDAAVFVSRHGELERSYGIIKELANKQDTSPTAFTMSVHNTAAGLFTIEAKAAIPVSSLSAGNDGFQQGLLEVQSMLLAGKKKVLLVDFDGNIPEVYQPVVSGFYEGLVYSLALIITNNDVLSCSSQIAKSPDQAVFLPQSLQFLKHYLLKDKKFKIHGARVDWQWQCGYV